MLAIFPQMGLGERENIRTFNLWAWTSNLSTIAKVAWITFTHHGDDSRPPLLQASSCLPDKWKRSLTHRVIIYLDYGEDHTTAPLDNFISTTDTAPYEPITSRLPWNLGVVDGMWESKGGRATCLPKHFDKNMWTTASRMKSVAAPTSFANLLAAWLTTTTHPSCAKGATTTTIMTMTMVSTISPATEAI